MGVYQCIQLYTNNYPCNDYSLALLSNLCYNDNGADDVT